MSTPLARLLPSQWFAAGAPSLPQRVRDRIRIEEERSEIFVGAIQLVFIASVAVLYKLAPRKFGADAPFAPVPWVLGAYAILTVARLALAVHRRLSRGFVYASIVIDMALLVGLIFSYHIQYAQPAASAAWMLTRPWSKHLAAVPA